MFVCFAETNTSEKEEKSKKPNKVYPEAEKKRGQGYY